jgi:hypothetical protein
MDNKYKVLLNNWVREEKMWLYNEWILNRESGQDLFVYILFNHYSVLKTFRELVEWLNDGDDEERLKLKEKYLNG